MKLWLFSKHNYFNKVFVAVVFMSACLGCKSTQDLELSDKVSPQLSLNATTELSNRFSVSAHVNVNQGDDRQTFGNSAIQINDIRFVSTEEEPLTVDYRFDLSTNAFLLDVYLVKGDFYQLVLSPGLSYFNYDADINVNGTDNFILNFNSFGLGAKLQNRFKLSEKLTFNLNLASFDNHAEDVGNLQWAKASLDYLVNEHLTVGLGYHYTLVADASNLSGNGDNCDVNDIAEDCLNSEVRLYTSGFMLELGYKF